MRRVLTAALILATAGAAIPAEAQRHHRTYDRGRYEHPVRCKRHGGTVGAIAGGAAGGLLGNAILGGTGGTLVGAAGGALGGRAIERSHKVRCR